MSIDLYNLDPEELWAYEYDRIQDVVQAIEQKLFNMSDEVEDIEAIVSSLEHINIITLRVEEYDFPEISKKITAESIEARNARQWLQLRLKMAFLSCKSVLDNARVVANYNEKKTELEQSIADLHIELEENKLEIDKSLTDAQSKVNNQLISAKNELQDSEHNVLTHVLTLMGVFSAVITIVMSVVITSSSWLNNADGASAVLAFVIPNAVAILAVIVLMFLVFLYTNASTGSDTHPIKSKVAINLFITLLVIVVVLTGSLIWTAVSYTQKCEPNHTHYIICSDEYTIVSRKIPNSNSEELYLQFTFEGKNYRFDFDERYIHNGNLYYCQEHNTIE